MRTIFLSTALLFAVAACSSPESQVIPSNLEAWQSDEKLQGAILKLSAEDQKTLSAWMLRRGLATTRGEAIPEGTTIAKAIEEERAWQKQRAAQQADGKTELE